MLQIKQTNKNCDKRCKIWAEREVGHAPEYRLRILRKISTATRQLSFFDKTNKREDMSTFCRLTDVKFLNRLNYCNILQRHDGKRKKKR